MPIYQYQCKACGHELEAIQKISDALLTDCPACGKPALSKQLTAAGFRLKGGGWYETDFKSGDKKKNLAGDGAPVVPAAATDSAKPASGGDAKPAAAPAAAPKTPAASS